MASQLPVCTSLTSSSVKWDHSCYFLAQGVTETLKRVQLIVRHGLGVLGPSEVWGGGRCWWVWHGHAPWQGDVGAGLHSQPTSSAGPSFSLGVVLVLSAPLSPPSASFMAGGGPRLDEEWALAAQGFVMREETTKVGFCALRRLSRDLVFKLGLKCL